jgi:hypothetical protein
MDEYRKHVAGRHLSGKSLSWRASACRAAEPSLQRDGCIQGLGKGRWSPDSTLAVGLKLPASESMQPEYLIQIGQHKVTNKCGAAVCLTSDEGPW